MLIAGNIASRRADSQVRGQSFNMMMVSESESAFAALFGLECQLM
jgi:hypothetical protein